MRGAADGERGAVAVVVAVAVALVLVPVSALALDLGSVYVREGLLQQVADAAASAGAAELASAQRNGVTSAQDTARAAAVAALCTERDGARWQEPCGADRSWAADGEESNGEVSFHTGRPSPDHLFTTAGAVTVDPGTLISGIRVATPPSRVTFGLAGAFTSDHVDLRGAATAGLFTVLPAKGFLPLYLAEDDHGAFCVQSAPVPVWGAVTLPYGACTPARARGYLAAGRTDPEENAAALTWNTATGFDSAHLPVPGGTATLQQQATWPYADLNALSAGLFGGFGVTGRLTGGSCPGGSDAAVGPYLGVESGYLTDFLVPGRDDRYAFRDLVRSGTAPAPAQQGWLDTRVLRCGRLAAVPVLGTVQDPPPAGGLPAGPHPVTGLRLVWLDDRLWSGEAPAERAGYGACLNRGVLWANPYLGCGWGGLRAYTGYVLDPRLLPTTVGAADAVTTAPEYLGSGLPVTVRLLRDPADPPAR
jgi:Flp pilus assembly protein TadG